MFVVRAWVGGGHRTRIKFDIPGTTSYTIPIKKTPTRYRTISIVNTSTKIRSVCYTKYPTAVEYQRNKHGDGRGYIEGKMRSMRYIQRYLKFDKLYIETSRYDIQHLPSAIVITDLAVDF